MADPERHSGLFTRIWRHYAASPASLLMHHIALFAIVALSGIALRLMGAPVPLFWPLGVWFMLLAGHFFFYRSFQVDEEWADDRADRLRRHSYDFQHIREIYKEPTTLKTPDKRSDR